MNLDQETALVVLAPEAEALLGPFRERYDPSAAKGMPAHITILYPFVPPEEVDGQVLDRLRELFDGFSASTILLTRSDHFPQVLYLAPEPARPLQELTRAAAGAFPKHPPYGGQFEKIVPHLTIGHVEQQDSLRQLSAEFNRASRGKLPIRVSLDAVWLMRLRQGQWQPWLKFPLAPGGQGQ